MSAITNILAVETTGSVCSVVLHTSNGVFEDTRNVARMHNQLLLGMIDGVVDQWGFSVQQLDCVAFGAGPGSFTGVRIGAATCQAIAFAVDVGVACVSSSEALATQALKIVANEADRVEGVLTLIDSVPGAAYLGAFANKEGCLQSMLNQTLVKGYPTLPAAVNSSWRIAGALWPDSWNEAGLEAEKSQPPCPYIQTSVDAKVIAELGLKMCDVNQLVTPELALPVYVSGDHPWK